MNYPDAAGQEAAEATMKGAAKMIAEITSINHLEELRTILDRRIEVCRRDQRGAAIEQMRKIAASVGIPLSELTKALSEDKKPQPAKLPAKYIHPTDPKLQWTGRGRKPQWIIDWLAGGRNLADIEVAK